MTPIDFDVNWLMVMVTGILKNNNLAMCWEGGKGGEGGITVLQKDILLVHNISPHNLANMWT